MRSHCLFPPHFFFDGLFPPLIGTKNVRKGHIDTFRSKWYKLRFYENAMVKYVIFPSR